MFFGLCYVSIVCAYLLVVVSCVPFVCVLLVDVPFFVCCLFSYVSLYVVCYLLFDGWLVLFVVCWLLLFVVCCVVFWCGARGVSCLLSLFVWWLSLISCRCLFVVCNVLFWYFVICRLFDRFCLLFVV